MALYSISQNAFSAIIEAESKRMEALFRAWDQEIERSFEALREEQKKLNTTKLQESIAASREQAQEVAASIAASVLLQRLSGAEVLAESSGLAVSVPEGLKVASMFVHGPSLSELSGVAAELQEELQAGGLRDRSRHAQASLAFALEHGLLPHPSELGRVIDELGISPEKAKQLIGLGDQLDRASHQNFSHPGLRFAGAQKTLDALKQTKDEVTAIGGESLLKLALRPESMRGQTLPYNPPGAQSLASGMSKPAFDQMLTGLFAKKK